MYMFMFWSQRLSILEGAQWTIQCWNQTAHEQTPFHSRCQYCKSKGSDRWNCFPEPRQLPACCLTSLRYKPSLDFGFEAEGQTSGATRIQQFLIWLKGKHILRIVIPSGFEGEWYIQKINVGNVFSMFPSEERFAGREVISSKGVEGQIRPKYRHSISIKIRLGHSTGSIWSGSNFRCCWCCWWGCPLTLHTFQSIMNIGMGWDGLLQDLQTIRMAVLELVGHQVWNPGKSLNWQWQWLMLGGHNLQGMV